MVGFVAESNAKQVGALFGAELSRTNVEMLAFLIEDPLADERRFRRNDRFSAKAQPSHSYLNYRLGHFNLEYINLC